MMNSRMQELPPTFSPAYGYCVEYDGGMASGYWFRDNAECDAARRRALWNLGYRLPRWWQFWRWGEGVVLSDDDRAWFQSQSGEGLFARKASTATAKFKRQGWRLVDDEWICPVCFRAGAHK